MTLPILRHEWDQRGGRYVTAEHPGGGNICLPFGWTDRSAPLQAPKVKGRAVRVAVEQLLALPGAVEVALGKRLEWGQGEEAMRTRREILTRRRGLRHR